MYWIKHSNFTLFPGVDNMWKRIFRLTNTSDNSQGDSNINDMPDKVIKE